MNRRVVLLLCASVIALSSCLEFGEDVSTTSPSTAQVDRCRRVMYLSSAQDITPLGFELQDSLDDLIHFKFRTDASAPAEIFDPSMVDPAAFGPGSFDPAACTADWWSGAEGEFLVLDHLEVAPARVLSAWVRQEAEGATVWVQWMTL